MATKVVNVGPISRGLVDDAHIEQQLIQRADKTPTGVMDEAPFGYAEVAVESGRMVVTVTGNPAYFDGEIEIMNNAARAEIDRIVRPYID